QAIAMRRGTRRLLLLTAPSPDRWVERQLSNADKLTLLTAPHGSLGAVLADAAAAAVDALMDAAGGPAWDAAAFAALRDRVAGAPARQRRGRRGPHARRPGARSRVPGHARSTRRGALAARGAAHEPLRPGVGSSDPRVREAHPTGAGGVAAPS